MNELDDLPLVRTQVETADDRPQPESARRSSPATIFVIAAVGLALGGTAAWWWMRDRPAVGPARADTAATEGVIPPSADAARALPPLDQMDTFLRALLATMSASPEFARWLATDDLIRQMANAIDRISRGLSPARDLQVLHPRREFLVSGRGPLTIDPASYGRYDALASLVDSLDAQAVAGAYRTVQPRLDDAYRALGRSEGSVDNAIGVALQILIDTPTPRDPVRLVHGKGATYAYADADLEKALPVQKQLMRMGPANVERIKTRVRAIKAAVETPPVR
jgi:hypothetical protein